MQVSLLTAEHDGLLLIFHQYSTFFSNRYAINLGDNSKIKHFADSLNQNY